jgi:sulfate adenylyltransferase subunit 1 (EFTu-like GTPase family)
MARPRQPGNGVLPIAGDRPIVPSTLRVAALEGQIQSVVSKRMGQRLGVAPASLPSELKTLISSASAAAAQQAVELAVTKDLEEAVGDVSRGSVLGRFDARVDLARKGLDHISASNDVKAIMKKRATMLAEKKAALENAGFSSTEAMEIVLADIAARGH